MVYTSSSLALAAMELFVHLDPTVAPDDLVSIAATIPSTLKVEQLASKDIPATWREIDNARLQEMGARWAIEKRSTALQVPSAVIEDEWNILLNPEHMDFSRVQITAPKTFHFDKRMFR